jgi:hypothetical protein
MTQKAAARLPVLCLSLLGGSACYAQGRFSQATPISGSQFFGALKAVSLDLRSDPSLAKFISLAEQESEITKALASYGIAVRPNMQVTLVVSAVHHDPVIESKVVVTGQVADSSVIHGIYIVTEFFLKTAALRNGKLHPVMAAPALGWSGSEQEEDTGLRKLLLGDQTRQDIRNRFVRIFGECLQMIKADTSPQETSWFVDSWTEKARAAADADYVKLMNPGTPVDKSPFEGLSSVPQIKVDPNFGRLRDNCKADPGWSDAWTRVFQRLGWTGSAPPRLALMHFFSCVGVGIASAPYYALSDVIYLLHSDLVFELDGRPVRKWGAIYLTHHERLALKDDMNGALGEFVPRNIQDSLTDLVLGNGPNSRSIPLGTQNSSGGPVPGGLSDSLADFLNAMSKNSKSPASTGPAPAVAPPAIPPPADDDPIGQGGFITRPASTAPAPDASPSTGIVSDPAKSLQWVRADMPSYVEASKTGFAAYKKGDVQLSQGYQMWDSLMKPAPAKGCWVVQGTSSTTFSCLLLERVDLNDLRSYYAELNKDIIASLPRDWKIQEAPPFGGDLPSQGYGSSSGAHLEVWIARAGSGAVYEIHFQLVSAH